MRVFLSTPTDYITSKAFAGLRSAEVMRLDRRNVKLGRGHIEIAAANAKIASRSVVPIQPNLASWLKAAAKKSGKTFPHTRPFFRELQRDISPKTKTANLAAMPWKHNALRSWTPLR